MPFISLYNPTYSLPFLSPTISPPPGTTACSAASTSKTKMGSAVYYTGREYEPHFLDSCFLCHRSLSQKHDIFMYRGNTPFCSQECREEQIEMDEAAEKIWKKISVRQLNLESAKESDTNKAMRTGTVAVAVA